MSSRAWPRANFCKDTRTHAHTHKHTHFKESRTVAVIWPHLGKQVVISHDMIQNALDVLEYLYYHLSSHRITDGTKQQHSSNQIQVMFFTHLVIHRLQTEVTREQDP